MNSSRKPDFSRSCLRRFRSRRVHLKRCLHLLRRLSHRQFDVADACQNLVSMLARVDSFLSDAPSVPSDPSADTSSDCDSTTAANDIDNPHISSSKHCQPPRVPHLFDHIRANSTNSQGVMQSSPDSLSSSSPASHSPSHSQNKLSSACNTGDDTYRVSAAPNKPHFEVDPVNIASHNHAAAPSTCGDAVQQPLDHSAVSSLNPPPHPVKPGTSTNNAGGIASAGKTLPRIFTTRTSTSLQPDVPAGASLLLDKPPRSPELRILKKKKLKKKSKQPKPKPVRL